MVGREFERHLFEKKKASGEAEFIAVYGRRRVGKTFLIREFFKDEICFELTGLHEGSMADQLREFAKALGKAKAGRSVAKAPASWQEAFWQLEEHLGQKKGKKKGRRVIFLDELPWLDTHRSKFRGALGQFWNTWASRQSDIILVVCGSAAAWMIRKLLHDRGGLHNRVTCRIRLNPFTLKEGEEFLRSRKVALSRKQVVEVMMVTGGIPHYLKEVERGKSAGQVIDALCFRPEGLLRDEFERLYHSLFVQADNHVRVVRSLSKVGRGLTRQELAKETGIALGGGLSKVLEELEESGFVEGSAMFGYATKDRHYRLIDEYSHFYLRWIEPNKRKSISWENIGETAKWKAWSGYAFESLCRRHVPQMKKALGIAGVQTEQSTWRQMGSEKESGAQVDLLIDRRDDCIHLCEMKFANGEFVIDKRYAERMRERRETFRRVSGTRKTLFLTMVTTFGVKENPYALELIQSQLVMDDLFG